MLKTFSSNDKPLVIIRKNEAAIILCSHQNLFSRLVTIGTARDVDLKSVLSHELTQVPLLMVR